MRASLPLLCLLVAAASAQHAAPARMTPHMIKRTIKHIPRQFLGLGNDGTDSTDPSNGDGNGVNTVTSASASATQTSATSTSARPTSTSSSAPASTYTSTSNAPTSTSSSSSAQPTSTSPSYRSTATQSQITSSTTNAAGSTIFTTETLAPSSTSAPAVPTASQTAATSTSSGHHTGLIIGVSVVGGLAALGALIFLWMKFSGKRFSDYQDEDADIKWPELKTDGDSAAMQPLPARRTGGAGFDMGNEFDDQPDADGQSMAEYGNHSATGSTTALNAGAAAAGAGAGAGAAGYGAGTYSSGMEGYHDETPSATNHYGQPVVAGYYDPYSNSAYPSAQPQTYYPEQGIPHEGSLSEIVQSPPYEDYNNYSADPYGAARAQAASTSPHMGPYRVNTQSSHRGY